MDKYLPGVTPTCCLHVFWLEDVFLRVLRLPGNEFSIGKLISETSRSWQQIMSRHLSSYHFSKARLKGYNFEKTANNVANPDGSLDGCRRSYSDEASASTAGLCMILAWCCNNWAGRAHRFQRVAEVLFAKSSDESARIILIPLALDESVTAELAEYNLRRPRSDTPYMCNSEYDITIGAVDLSAVTSSSALSSCKSLKRIIRILSSNDSWNDDTRSLPLLALLSILASNGGYLWFHSQVLFPMVHYLERAMDPHSMSSDVKRKDISRREHERRERAAVAAEAETTGRGSMLALLLLIWKSMLRYVLPIRKHFSNADVETIHLSSDASRGGRKGTLWFCFMAHGVPAKGSMLPCWAPAVAMQIANEDGC